MNHGPKCKIPDYKIEDNTGENLDDFGIHGDFLDINQKYDPWKKSISKKQKKRRASVSWTS